MKLLIGYDGSDCADAALDDLTRAGLPGEVEARILCVAEVWLPPLDPAEKPDQSTSDPTYAKAHQALREADRLAERARNKLSSLFPSWQIVAETASGSPAWELVLLADRWQPDLVAVGSNGRTALGRFVLGSVSERVLTEARASVRICRGREQSKDTRVRLVLGVDGSVGSEQTVKEVARRSWPANSEVRVVIVDDPFFPQFINDLLAPISESVRETQREELSWAQEVLAKTATTLRGAGLKVTTEVRQGDPKRELPKVAESCDADCIFVGSQGFSNRLERFVLGSVSAAVAARSQCSVEVVRGRPEERKD